VAYLTVSSLTSACALTEKKFFPTVRGIDTQGKYLTTRGLIDEDTFKWITESDEFERLFNDSREE
jgi:hypothetical protein